MKYTLFATMLLLGACDLAHAGWLPRPDHVIVVIMENRGYSQIMDMRNGNSYIHALARRAVHAVLWRHASEPAELSGAVFRRHAGHHQQSLPEQFQHRQPRLDLAGCGFELRQFRGGVPATGDLNCSFGAYQRKHNPLSNWQGTCLSAGLNQRFADFPQDFSRLPTVSFVMPYQNHDMHDGSFSTADGWLKTRIAPYVDWVFRHNSLLILTWDEDDFNEGNRVVTILVGPMVKTGYSDQRIDHYNVLRTLLDFYGLPAPGAARDAEAIKGVWKKR